MNNYHSYLHNLHRYLPTPTVVKWMWTLDLGLPFKGSSVVGGNVEVIPPAPPWIVAGLFAASAAFPRLRGSADIFVRCVKRFHVENRCSVRLARQLSDRPLTDQWIYRSQHLKSEQRRWCCTESGAICCYWPAWWTASSRVPLTHACFMRY